MLRNRLRNTKIVDCVVDKHQRKIIRDYSSKLNLDIRKTRTVRSLSSLSMLLNKNPESSIMQDALDMLSMLNDNDMLKIYRYKQRLYDRISEDEKDEMIDLRRYQRFRMIDDDGEIIESPGDD